MKHRETIDINPEAIQVLKNNQLLQQYTELRKGGKLFINKAIRINQAGEPFTFQDFMGFGKKYFKSYVFYLRHAGLIEVIGKSVYAYYRVKGFRLNRYWEKLTLKATGVPVRSTEYSQTITENTYQFLKEYFNDLDYPALHNIRLHFYDYSIYNTLETLMREGKRLNDIDFNSRNKSFIIHSNFSMEHDCSVKIMVTPTNLVQIMIKNTLKPLVVDENGVFELNVKLGQIREYLSYYSYKIPPVSNWLFVRADFGRDCKRPLHRIFPTMELRDVTGALVRLYAKDWPDNTCRLRVETIITPKKPMNEMPEFLETVKMPEISLLSVKNYN